MPEQIAITPAQKLRGLVEGKILELQVEREQETQRVIAARARHDEIDARIQILFNLTQLNDEVLEYVLDMAGLSVHGADRG